MAENKYLSYVNTENLRRERYSKKYSLLDMAMLLGKKSASSYRNLEEGNVEPRISEMVLIAKIFGQPVQYFFNLDVQENQTA